MSIYPLFIAPVARDDLKDIYQYGRRHWGHARSDAYLEDLNELFWALREQPSMGVVRPDLQSGTRSLSIQSHIVFYRVSGEQIEIIRVLHGRQDPHFHLK